MLPDSEITVLWLRHFPLRFFFFTFSFRWQLSIVDSIKMPSECTFCMQRRCQWRRRQPLLFVYFYLLRLPCVAFGWYTANERHLEVYLIFSLFVLLLLLLCLTRLLAFWPLCRTRRKFIHKLALLPFLVVVVTIVAVNIVVELENVKRTHVHCYVNVMPFLFGSASREVVLTSLYRFGHALRGMFHDAILLSWSLDKKWKFNFNLYSLALQALLPNFYTLLCAFFPRSPYSIQRESEKIYSIIHLSFPLKSWSHYDNNQFFHDTTINVCFYFSVFFCQTTFFRQRTKHTDPLRPRHHHFSSAKCLSLHQTNSYS